MSRLKIAVWLFLSFAVVALILVAHSQVRAHCDTMDGPVVQAAEKALEAKNVELVLMWVRKDDEAEIREMFDKTLAVRGLDPQARDLVDMYFFETLVRIHRAGEGVAYTGLKPAGTEVEPGIAEADKAVETGVVDELVRKMSSHMAAGIQERFERVAETRKHMNNSVDAGREYVEAYVVFIHYVEAIHQAIIGQATDQHGSANSKEDTPLHH